jgi:predicted Zn-dependent peptidase
MYNTVTLPNGLRIIHRYCDSPIVYCGYQIAGGTRNEKKGCEGLAHFCEHMSFKGTERRSPMQIINCLEKVGGELNAFTAKESTVYYAAVLKELVPKAADLLTDIVFRSTYPAQEIAKEVEVICDEIESYNDSPAELIYDDFENIIFGNYPLGHNILGTQANVRAFTTADAADFTSRFYIPANAIFFCYGDIDFRRLCRLIEKQQDNIGTGKAAPAADDILSAELPERKRQTVIRDKGTHQAHVMIGTRAYGVHDRRRMPLYLLNNILGGPSMNARLNLSLREKQGLVYTVESSMVSYGDTGLWSTYFGCDPKDINTCLHSVRKELDRLMSRPLTETQLRTAKKQIKGQIALGCDNHENFALDFGKAFLHYGWEKDIETLYRRIEELTAQQLQETAQEIFSDDIMTTLIYK